jgi:hypothetical protein
LKDIVTPISITKELEEFKEKLDLYKASLSLWLSKEYKYAHIGMDRVKVETLYKGEVLSAYIIEVKP